MSARSSLSGLFGLAFLTLVACQSDGPGGARILDESEDDTVGATRAGAPTYDRLIEEAVGKLLANHSVPANAEDRLQVAFLDVDNRASEELGEWREQIRDLIAASINSFEGYDIISSTLISQVLRQERLDKEQLLLPAPQRRFAAVLEKAESPVDFLLFARITRGSTEGVGSTQRNYALTLEFVDVESGKSITEVARIRKEYTGS